MIIDIRGTNGSGKSYPIAQLLNNHYHRVELWDTAHEKSCDVTVVPELELAVLGTYRTACGGADGITKQDAICDLIRSLYPMYKTVIVEGSIVASVFKRWHDLAVEFNDDYQFWFLSTPVDECIKGVLDRRQKAGNTKPFDPHKTLIPRHEAILKVKDRLVEAKRVVVNIDRDCIVSALLRRVQLNCGAITE